MDGRGHLQVWKYGAIPTALAAVTLGAVSGDPTYAVGAVVGYGLGRWIDPDLDLVGMTNSESRLMKDLKLFGAVIVAWFVLYAYLMRFIGLGRKGHRNFFSHFPVVSTAIRLGWLLLIPAGAVWYFSLSLPTFALAALLGVLFGLSVADTLHYLGDVF